MLTMDRSKNIIQDESPNLSSNPVYYQPGSENRLLDMGIQQPFPTFASPFDPAPSNSIPHMDWNPSTMLDNLTFIEEKIRQAKDVIRSMVGNGGQLSAQQQQQVNADLTCLIVQLISTAGSLLPSLKNSSFLSHPPGAGQTDNLAGSGTSSSSVRNAAAFEEHKEEMRSPDYGELFKGLTDCEAEGIDIDNSLLVEEYHDTKDGSEAVIAIDAVDSLPPGSYELLQLEEDEILAPHTHFCAICGKGFKRDANLRMHMRGHGDKYKTAAALSKPPRDTSLDHATTVKRYSCPFAGCKRNKLHKSFLPLKTIHCVKNHYKRSHCEKSYTCSRCHAKKFSIMADLKTHEKHCGQVKWLCSCGTTFSSKDKLFAHVGLFKGHTPLLPADEPEGRDKVAPAGSHQEPAKLASSFMWGDSSANGGAGAPLGVDGLDSCTDDFLSTANFGSFGFGLAQFDGFPEENSDGSFMLLPPDHYQGAEKKGES